MAVVTAVLRTVASVPAVFKSMALRCLVLDSAMPGTSLCMDMLLAALNAKPVEVTLQGAIVSHDVVSAVLAALVRNQRLKKLDLSQLQVISVDPYPLDAVLAAGLAHMASLQSLSLQGCSYGGIESKPLSVGVHSLLPAALSNLTKLTGLDLGCRIAGSSPLCSSLQGMSQLQALTLLFDATTSNSADQLSTDLCKLTLLRTLKLSEMTNSEGHPRVSSSLASSLRSLIHMQTLDLAGCSMVDAGVMLLSSTVQHMNQLTFLSLRTEKVSEGTLVGLFDGLQSCPQLHTICVHVPELNRDGTGQLFYNKLCNLTTLQALALHMAWPSIADSEEPIGQHLARLSHLNLAQCMFEDTGTQSLLSMIGSLCGLRELDVRDTELGERGIKAFAAGLAVATTLLSLQIGFTGRAQQPYSHSHAMVLAPALGRLSSLTELALSGAFQVEGLEVICHVLGKLVQLRTLDVSHNALDPDGAEDLQLALSSLLKLECLNISSCSLSRKATCFVASGLVSLENLEYLDMSGALVNEKNVTQIAGSLQNLKALKSLSLQRVCARCSNQAECANNISVLGVGLYQLTNLTQLDLSSNAIGDDGAKAVAKLLQALPCLRRVALKSPGMTDMGAQVILESLRDTDPARCFDLARSCRRMVQPL